MQLKNQALTRPRGYLAIGLSILLTWLSAGCFAGFLLALGQLTAQILQGRNLTGQWWLLFVLAGLVATCEGLRVALEQHSIVRQTDYLQSRLLDWVFGRGSARLKLERGGALVDLMTSGSEKIAQYRQGYLGGMLGGLTVPFLVLGILALTIDPLSALILSAFIPLIPLLVWGFRKITKAVSGRSRRARNALAAAYLEAIRGLETLSVLGVAERRADQLAAAGEKNRQATMRLLAANQLILFIIDAGFNLLLITTSFALVAWRLETGFWGSGPQAIGKAVAFIGLSFLLLEPMGQIGGFFYVGMGGMANQRRVKRLWAAPPSKTAKQPSAHHEPAGRASEPAQSETPAPLQDTDQSLGSGPTEQLQRPEADGQSQETSQSQEKCQSEETGRSQEKGQSQERGQREETGLRTETAPVGGMDPTGESEPTGGMGLAKGENLPEVSEKSAAVNPVIALENLSFAYPQGPLVLEQLNFEVSRGEKIAICGPSGGGKTTLMALLKGELLPTAGSVQVAGVELCEATQGTIRGSSALVQQHTWAFTGSIRTNLTLVNPLASDRELWQVLAQVKLAERVRSFPQQLDTPLGEGGLGLSGGELQRLSLGRALLSGRKLLLLDEPTSQIDLASEAAILEAVSQLDHSFTVVMNTHRGSALSSFDQIWELTPAGLVKGGALRPETSHLTRSQTPVAKPQKGQRNA